MSLFTWTDRSVRTALGLNPDRADDEVVYGSVTTDSRDVGEDALFVALVGDRFDGHDFVADAAAAGATGAVVSRPVPGADTLRLYPVDDTLEAYGRLARHRRRTLNATVVGITGSSGKTTTKELLRGALGARFRVHATEMNYNNRIGLPRTLLETPDDAQVVVVEMGTSEPGEIAALAAVAEPEYGILTTVSEAHLERLGSIEGVFDEKLDLLRGLTGAAVAVVSDEPASLPERARSIHGPRRIRVAGWSDEADEDLRPVEPESDSQGCFHFRWKGQAVALGIPGRHAVLDAILALAVSEELGVKPASAAKAIGTVTPVAMRGEIRSVGSLTVLVDCYNSNPESLRASLELLATHPELGPRVAVLGSMLELGEASDRLHREALGGALERPLDLIVAIGAFAEAARAMGVVEDDRGIEAGSDAGDTPGGAPDASAPRVLAVDTVDEAYPLLLPELKGGEVVLLKASRGVKLETLIPLLEWDFGAERDDTEETSDDGSEVEGAGGDATGVQDGNRTGRSGSAGEGKKETDGRGATGRSTTEMRAVVPRAARRLAGQPPAPAWGGI